MCHWNHRYRYLITPEENSVFFLGSMRFVIIIIIVGFGVWPDPVFLDARI